MLDKMVLTNKQVVHYNKIIRELLKSDEMPLKMVAEQTSLKDRITIKQLRAWESRRRHNNFPEPSRKLGKYKFYFFEEVVTWVIHWQRVSSNLGNKELNNHGPW